MVGYFVIGSVTRVFAVFEEFGQGSQEGWVDLLSACANLVLLVVLWRKPTWFIPIVNIAIGVAMVEGLAATVLLGGIVPGELVILFGVLAVVGALIVLRIRDAFLWCLVYLTSLVVAMILPDLIGPAEPKDWSTGGIVFNVIAVTIFLFAGMAYFVRQRDGFQRESDELLHSILPDEIARRLKAERSMIADDYPSGSILFADVVGFTPMSSGMTPTELVGLLNTLFSTFDGFVEDLGLEKIKTIGDAYMVAAGVPEPRPDHAEAIAELALRIREYTTGNDVCGQNISMRIGINSGPMTAGIVGTHKFAYDLWGDVVNTASRMESNGIAGSIQVTEATYRLLVDDFVFESRGLVRVKGKGDMETFLLLDRKT
jgi:guanylate cyclase